MEESEKQAIFDALDIVNANKDEAVPNLVRRGVLTEQQARRIDYLMQNAVQRAQLLDEWKKERQAHIHPGLKEIALKWTLGLTSGVCQWCGSEIPADCVQGHVIEAANNIINSLTPKPARRKKKGDVHPEAQAAFDDAMGG